MRPVDRGETRERAFGQVLEDEIGLRDPGLRADNIWRVGDFRGQRAPRKRARIVDRQPVSGLIAGSSASGPMASGNAVAGGGVAVIVTRVGLGSAHPAIASTLSASAAANKRASSARRVICLATNFASQYSAVIELVPYRLHPPSIPNFERLGQRGMNRALRLSEH